MELVDKARILCEFLERCRDDDSFDNLSESSNKGLEVALAINSGSEGVSDDDRNELQSTWEWMCEVFDVSPHGKYSDFYEDIESVDASYSEWCSKLETHETSLEDKAQIIVEFTQRFFSDFEYGDFFDYNDLGTPLAIAITQDMADLTESGREILEETWTNLCELFDVDETLSYEQIEDLMSEDIESNNLHGEVSEILEIAKDYAVKSHSSESSNLDPSVSFQEILDGLAQIFHEVTGTSIDPSDYEKKMNEELGIDSLALVEGLMACEDMFGIEIPDTKVFELDSLSKVAQFISSNRGN